MFGIKTKILNYVDHKFLYDDLKRLRLDPSGIICNHKCIMCWQQQQTLEQKKAISLINQKNALKIKDYYKLINSLPRSVKSIELVGGGEPLIYPDIQKLIIIIKKKKLFGILISNGALLNKKNREILIESAWDTIRISLHAATKKTYNLIHGKDDFELVIKNIKSLINERKNSLPYIKLLFVIQKNNAKEINTFINLAEKLRVDEIEFDYLIPNSKDELFLTNKEINSVKIKLKKAKTKTNIRNNIESTIEMFNNSWNPNQKNKKKKFENKVCYLNHLEISQIGATSPCCLLLNTKLNKNLNVKKMDIKDIWKAYKPFRKNLREGNFPKDCLNNCYYKLKNKH